MTDSDDCEPVFTINKAYAKKYSDWRRKEEYQKLKDKYGDDILESSSSSEVEDDDAQEITPEFEKQFLKALASVKSKDPRIYDKEVKFFEIEEDGNKEDVIVSKLKEEGKKKKKEKPMYLKDYERKIILEKGGRFSDDEAETMEPIERPSSPTYVEEQERIKSSFHDALQDSEEEEENDESFLTKRKKTKEEKEKDEEEYIQWLKGEREELKNEEVMSEAKDVGSLRDYWSNPQLDDGEKFLRDYILDKAYKPHGDENEFESFDEDLSEDDRLLDDQEEFERKYNFRFEEPDSELVKSYPRNIEGSLRRKDTSRANKRQEMKERKAKEKQKLHEELKKLKNLKKMEILEQLEKLKRVTGNTIVGFSEEDIKGDFDADKHDSLMQNVFNEQYDNFDEDKTKPVFEDDELVFEDWDEWTGNNIDHHDNSYHGDELNGESQVHCEDPHFNMDADYDPQIHKKDKKKKNKKDKKNKTIEKPKMETLLSELDGRRPRNKHTSEFAKALQNDRPVFDPDDKTFEEYFEEYYKLDYEDIIGDLPCRFKYRTVVANDFGLSTEEILSADDKELNRWVPLRKASQYRTKNEELSDLSSFQTRGQNVHKKQQILQSLYKPREEDESEEGENHEEAKQTEEPVLQTKEPAPLPEVAKEKKKKKKKKRHLEEEMGEQVAVLEDEDGKLPGDEDGALHIEETKKNEEVQEDKDLLGIESKKSRKRRLFNEMTDKKRKKMARRKEISDARLKAYGVRPKSYKYKLIQDRIKDKNRKKQK